MNKIIISFVFLILCMSSCKKDSAFLDVKPPDIIDNDEIYQDPVAINSVLSNLYRRIYDQIDLNGGGDLDDWRNFVGFGESFPSDGDYGTVQNREWDYGSWSIWDYSYIRELNLFLKRLGESTSIKVSEDQKKEFLAEGRFLRASYYFEMVKRMGGVPLILEPLDFEQGDDVTQVQFPRAKEYEIYDFVINEAEEIKKDLPIDRDGTLKDRATQGAVLAMECRAALYAASIAKYGAKTPQVSLSGGEVGIPASKAEAYYQKALNAADSIIAGNAGPYSLYMKQPSDLSNNFASLFTDKSGNPEMIFIKDYQLKAYTHGFTVQNQPRFGSDEEGDAGRINPSLNLVQSFEKLDNTFAPIPITDGAGNRIRYDDPLDAFAGRDARLAGTILLPGATFKQKDDIWNGVLLPDGSTLSGDVRGATRDYGSFKNLQVVGQDGPVNGQVFTAQTGFYIRKFLDPKKLSGGRGTRSDIPLPRYRYAEVLLNAAEAAFELQKTDVAAQYLNEVRRRAGFKTDLTPAQITFDRIVHERRVELAFEGHYLFDMKRWRLATSVWNGQAMSPGDLLNNIGSATKPNTQPYGLWASKVYDPAQPDPAKWKWVYKIVLPSKVTAALSFRLGNYYSRIGNDIIGKNPKLVQQPNQ
ncbi:hypothetical protein A8C56_06865 [Niabella ginsenosidivorans]|uniref:Starch-binding protein n=1 Tax=Niabella ginsenosidivorans TaxID=1176587 RepID=A0A1A9I071_9BACT|nr:RagB/SusD family nutrient uptake outer membrane protein [Niabella ginsenosidivorans]ANH80735.1 hypothetical protein A8C56_06865 [Niabella ginsenosidivorans]